MQLAFEAQQLWEWMGQFDKWLEEIGARYGYPGIFLISFIGASSIVIPIPYTLFVFTFGSLLDPLLVAISAGAGSTLGEAVGYFLGYYGRAVLSEDRQRKMQYIVRVFSRYGALTIFLFSLTPLPDDLLFIPLGIMRYSFLKAFVPAFLGKMLMCFTLAYGGHFSIEFIKSLLGDGGGIWTSIAVAILLLVIVVLMLKVDWEKVFPLEEKEKGEKRKKT